MTEWREIPEYEGLYKISDDGQIWSYRRRRNLKPAPTKKGYLHVNLFRDGLCRTFTVHRLVALTFIGPRPEGAIIRHLDGDQLNNHYTNLRYGTAGENLRDAVRHGTHHEVIRTHCPYGHPYDDENTYHYKGHRMCKICRSKPLLRQWNAKHGVISDELRSIVLASMGKGV